MQIGILGFCHSKIIRFCSTFDLLEKEITIIIMSAIYDNWERLVAATLRREQLWQLFHAHSRSPSTPSIATDFSSSSSPSDLPFDFLSSSPWYEQNSLLEIVEYKWGHNASDLEAKSGTVEELTPGDISINGKPLGSKELSLAPGDIIVNGKPLSSRELIMLLSCRHPPKKLRPGNYWYDKFSGFWGKQGHKPSQIISANLNIGGFLQQHASSGNTLVFINNREITKLELRVLQFVDGRCDRHTRLWLNDDGSYEEEGANNIRGNIWSKVGVRLLCSIFSLPFPPKSSYTSGEPSASDNFEERSMLQKILLIGCSGSGTSTIFKQAVFLYKDVPFLEDELEHIKLLIQSNMYGYIRVLLEGHKQFEEANLNESRESQPTVEHGLTEFPNASHEKSIRSFGPRLKAFSDWILQFTESSNSGIFSASFIQATAPIIEELWRNPAFQETFLRRRELQRLHNAAHYFLERPPVPLSLQAVHLFKPDYEPSTMDILCAERFPSSLSYVDFSFPPPRDDEFEVRCQQDFTTRYQLIMPNGPGDNTMLYKKFEDIQIVIFCISLCDYDQFVIDDNLYPVNKMIYNRHCFESTVTNPVFDQKGFLLLLTKYDLFEEKIKQIPLYQCDWFDDFHPVSGAVRESRGEMGFQYISVKFKMLYRTLTGRKLHVAKVNSLKQDSVNEALRYAREIVMWEEEISEYVSDIIASDTTYDSESNFYSDDS